MDTARLLDSDPAHVARTFMLRELSPQTRATIENSIKENSIKENPLKEKQTKPTVTVAGLVLGSPEFQRR